MFGMLEPGIARASRMSSPSGKLVRRQDLAPLPAITAHKTRYRPDCRPTSLSFPTHRLPLTEEMLIRRRKLAGARVVTAKIKLHTLEPGFLGGNTLARTAPWIILNQLSQAASWARHRFAMDGGDAARSLVDPSDAGSDAKLGGRRRQCSMAQDRLDLTGKASCLPLLNTISVRRRPCSGCPSCRLSPHQRKLRWSWVVQRSGVGRP